jgi:hypothetical protein
MVLAAIDLVEGFFDFDERLSSICTKGNPLTKVSRHTDSCSFLQTDLISNLK